MITKQQTIEALKGSIAKWEGIRDGTMQEEGRNNCPLCQLFYPPVTQTSHVFLTSPCEGCPIYAKTGQRICEGTPYEDYITASNDDKEPVVLAFYAQQEVDFLYGLMEELTNE